MISRLLTFMIFLQFLLVPVQSVFAQDTTLRGIAAKEIAIAMKSLQYDMDYDGRIDRWEYYNSDEILVHIEEDTNHDGRVDQWSDVKNGEIIAIKRDTDLDGKPDQTLKY